ncbi:B-cell receptor-associated protein 31-like-domain-containing protein [Zopfochytrium polystomum]|nr:B-cell receptor-associated protein 31-like-domain-containing protein [Zopfochytrium polystomum]
MSIFNQITALLLAGELVAYLLSLVPLTFIPVRSRKAALHACAALLANDTVKWLSRLVLLIVAGVFVDTVSRLYRLDESLHKGHHHHEHGIGEATLEDLQYKTKLFYSQRNMYLSVASLFMILVLYRRMKDVYLILQLQEQEESSRTTIKALKEQVTMIIQKADPNPSSSKAASTAGDKDSGSAAAPAAPAKPSDPTEQSGIRKRGGGGGAGSKAD